MKCLVTGGAGFIGSYLCDRLLAEGHVVTCVDNFLTGNKKNIEHLLSNPRFHFLEHDCINPLPENIHAEFVFHFASPASPPKYQQYPLETLLVNSVGTYELLKKCKIWNAGFLFASTSEVYGDPKEHPQKESYWGHVNPVGPRSCYDESKRVGETFVMTYRQLYGLDTRIVRIFNTYGPRMDIDDGRVVTNFIGQMLNKKPLLIYGDGSQTRSFCYVSDLVEGIYRMFQTPQAAGEIVNLGNPDEYTIKEFAGFISKLSGYKGGIEYRDLPQDDPLKRQPDITKVKKLLDWEPQVDLKVGLEKTLAYFTQKTA